MKTAFLFSGQGAQYPGMGKELMKYEEAAQVFEAADKALGRSVSGLCFEGTAEELLLTHNTQPTVLAVDLAAGAALAQAGVLPDAVAGFSLGEYAALTFAGVMSREDAFSLIQLRADAMQKAVPVGKGAMAAMVGVPLEKVEDICRRVTAGYVIPANYNSPQQTVLSGSAEGIREALQLAEAEGLRCMKLAVSVPFHCAWMEPAARELGNAMEGIPFNNPSVPVYMNVDGKPLRSCETMKEMLVRQAMSPVQWVRTLEEMAKDGIDTFIECGPGKTLSGLVKKTLKDVRIFRVEDEATLRKTLEGLS